MLNTEPMFDNNQSAAKQFGAAFATTGLLGKLFFSFLAISGGATWVAAECGMEKFGRVFVICAVSLSLIFIIARAVLRRYFVTLLDSHMADLSDRQYDHALIQVVGGVVTAVSRCALWGKENILHLTIPVAPGGIHGFPVMLLEEGSLTIPIKYLDFDHNEKSTPITWQALYDFALLNNNRNIASVGMGLLKAFQEEAQKRRGNWTFIVRNYLAGEISIDRFAFRLAQEVTRWDLCPFAPVVIAIGELNLRDKNIAVLG